jgi:hypothetical protein
MDNGHMVLLIFEAGGEDRFITGWNQMTALTVRLIGRCMIEATAG